MTINKKDIIPLYYQLADVLRELIKTEEFAPGDPLPSESELIEKYEISRGTVRQAFQILTQEGLIERYPGRGSFVSYPKLPHDARKVIGFFSQAALNAGKKPGADILQFKEIIAPAFVQERLRLGANERVVLVERLRYINNEPWAIERAHFVLDVGRLLKKEALKESLYNHLQKDLHINFFKSQNTIEASQADKDTARLLGIKTGHPVLIISRIVYRAEGDAIECSVDTYRADRIKFTVEDLYHTESKSIVPSPKEVNQVF